MLDDILNFVVIILFTVFLAFCIWLVYLQIQFLRKGIRFFDHWEQDRVYRQWLEQQKFQDNQKNG